MTGSGKVKHVALYFGNDILNCYQWRFQDFTLGGVDLVLSVEVKLIFLVSVGHVSMKIRLKMKKREY